MFSMDDFEMKDFIGEWVYDVRIEPTAKDIEETVRLFDYNPTEFEFSEDELNDALKRLAVDLNLYKVRTIISIKDNMGNVKV